MIRYSFLPEQGGVPFVTEIDRHRRPAFQGPDDAPGWTHLAFYQCTNCSLDSARIPSCPAALDLEPVISHFLDHASTERFRVEVETPERLYVKNCDLQTGLQSLMGLVMATSGCPVLGKFHGPALYHLPFATLEETLLRIVGFYLLKQYFLVRKGATPDMELRGLSEIYTEVRKVNDGFYRRVSAVADKDGNRNAILNWEYTSELMVSLDAALAAFEPLFVSGSLAPDEVRVHLP